MSGGDIDVCDNRGRTRFRAPDTSDKYVTIEEGRVSTRPFFTSHKGYSLKIAAKRVL